MPDPRFSVLIPARGAVKYLGPCLSSVFSQDCSALEVIVGVDGCPDTLKEIARLRPTLPPMRVLWGEKCKGAYVTRNTLAHESRGEFLIFFDADDLMLPGLIGWCEGRFGEKPVSQFRFRQRWEYLLPPATSSVTSKSGARGAFGIRRDSFTALGGFKAWPCSADSEFQRRAVTILGPPALSPAPLFIYRRHRASLTRDSKTGVRSTCRMIYHKKIRLLTPSELSSRIEPTLAEMSEVAT